MQSFTISPPAGDPPTLQGNTGKVTFTVTNTATRSVSGTVMAKPTAPAEESWFSFAEGATRTYQPGAVMSVATTITVPAGTAEGTYTFRLDAKAEDNPDEDYTEGPSAQFIVAAAPKPVPWWKRYWWIIAIVAVVLIGIVLAIVLLSGGDDDVAVTPVATEEPGEPGLPARNCVAIAASSIQIREDTLGFGTLGGFDRFVVLSSRLSLGTYGSREDADRVVALAQAFRRRCRIGKVEYWLDGTRSRPPQDDCIPYEPSRVVVVPDGPLFVVQDPESAPALGKVESKDEADALAKVAAAFKLRCFIGRFAATAESDDPRFPPFETATTVMDYWL